MDKLELEKRQLLDLRKNKVLDLSKSKGMAGQKATVIFVADFSGSMSDLYRKGAVQELAERILPLGLAFDDNGEVDFYIFHEGFHKLPENLTLNNFTGYINNKIIGKYSMGSTDYTPVIKDIIKQFGGGNVVSNAIKSAGSFFGFGKKTTIAEELVPGQKLDNPVYVIFVTDGNTDNQSQVEQTMIEASKYGIFFQFIGIGNASFSFLERLDQMPGRFIDNANFFKVPDIARKTDDELYGLLLNEFPSYVVEARRKGLIK